MVNDRARDTPSGHRAVERCLALGSGLFSDSETGLYRPFLGPAHLAATEAIAGWMEQAGMTTRIDAAANLVGRYEAATPSAPALLIGSHIDSVTDAGVYDGPLGVMLGVECIAALNAGGRRLPFAVEVIAFGDEEGSRFPASMLCSRAVAGTLDPAATEATGRDGVTLAQAMAARSLDVAHMANAARPAGSVLAYLEAHIEQGPVLEAEGLAVGVVTGIAAQKRFAITVLGQAGHAGTNAMSLRRDALAAAAEMLLAIEGVARAGADGVVATVGRMIVAPGAANVVPGRVDFTLDVRAGTDALRDMTAADCVAAVRAVAEARRVRILVEESQALAASPCDLDLTDRLAEAVASIGQPVRRLVSGAGHDAMTMAALAPTAMLFIRCEGGISHNPDENVMADDVELALQAMLAFIGRLAAQPAEDSHG